MNELSQMFCENNEKPFLRNMNIANEAISVGYAVK